MSSMRSVILSVQGMSCSSCANAVTRIVQRLDTSAKVRVDLEAKRVAIDTAKPAQDFANALTSGGYPAVASAA
jgi:copper chaperone